MAGNVPAATTIDGVSQQQLAWVRVTGGQDVARAADGTITLSGWKPEDALRALDDWSKNDGIDTRKVSATFRNSVHGALNHHVSDHTLGSWAEKPVVVVAPVSRMIDANGPPASLNTVDTYWTLDGSKGLPLPGATVIRPDQSFALHPSETSRRLDASSVVYAITFNEEREKQLVQQLSPHQRSVLAQQINARTGREGMGEDATLAVPRVERSAGLSAAVDAELAQLSKRAATNAAVAEIGPVRLGNNYSWQGSTVQDDTERMAQALGTKSGQHTGSSEDRAVDLMRAGRAADVPTLVDVAPQTKHLSMTLAEDARYHSYAQAKAVDRELGAAAPSGDGTTLTTAARERLALMVERSTEGLTTPPIQALNRYGKLSGQLYTATSSDGAGGEALSEGKIGDAIQQNARIGTLIRTALTNEIDPVLSSRLAAALDHLLSSNAALGSQGLVVHGEVAQPTRDTDPRHHPIREDRGSTKMPLDNPNEAVKPTAPETTKAGEKEPIRELLEHMARQSSILAVKDPSLARTIETLSQQANDPARLTQEGFKTRVAYALQDTEKHTGRIEVASPRLREEMHQLAGTAPGLENERMQELVKGSHLLHDRSLLSEIRKSAYEIGARVDQKSPDIESRVDALENRVRLAMRVTEPVQAPQSQQATPQASTGADQRQSAQRPSVIDANLETGTSRQQPPFAVQPDSRFVGGNQNQTAASVQHSVLDTLLRAMRPDGRQPPPPWEPHHTAMVDRVAAEDRRVQARSDDKTFEGAEKSGKAALAALQGFANSEGAAVMSKIREAAKTEPGGMAQVLSEMKEGGRFNDLRKQFSNAMADDAGVATAYDKAASSLAAYGKSRTDVQDIIGRRGDNAALTQRFDQLDAEIGKAASTAPSKTEGRSMMEDLGKQAAELLQRAVETVKAAFRSPSAGPSPGAGSSPSMSP